MLFITKAKDIANINIGNIIISKANILTKVAFIYIVIINKV